MIILMISLILSKRDYGTMLVAERKTEVYRRTDGGDGKGVSSKSVSDDNKPEDTPGTQKAYNMIFPILILVSCADGDVS